MVKESHFLKNVTWTSFW